MESSSISVAVRVRPWSDKEAAQLSPTHNVGPALFGADPSSSTYSTPQPPPRSSTSGSLRKILKVLDDRILVFDPPETNTVASFHRANFPVMGKKVKDIRFCFDKVFDEECGQEEVYDGSAKELVGHVMNGFHSTVFAYGATGCGKTHTISGSSSQPGIVFLIMKDLFARITAKSDECDFSLTVSYLEIYNETIRDLLAPESGPLQLREANGTATPAGLSSKEPTCAADVVEWITLGNQNRTVNATEANATSSRSHAVLSVTVTQKPKAGGMTDNTQTASLSVIDLAGSERASVTKNKGDRLIEGANINRSLLALGNCINALCDPRKRGHVPYRDSKLTRLLKQSLGGNCKTVMIVCVSPSSAHYDETHNTLQYANRAKEIKTKAVRNVVSVDRHVAQYCQQIMEQAARIKDLEAQVAMSGPVAGAGGVEQYDAGAKAVQLAKGRLTSQWEQGRDRLVNSERARSQKAGLSEILDILAQWRTTAFHNDVEPAAAPTVALVKTSFEHFVQNLAFAASRLDEDISRGRNALEFYSSMVASQTESIRKNHPQALAQLQLEVRVLELRLEGALGEAREFGLSETNKGHARAMHNMLDATVKVSRALDDARVNHPDTADALSKFLAAVGFANQTAFLLLTQETSLVGTKRDAGARSPLEPEAVWGSAPGRKAPRESVVGIGSAPTGALASPMRPSTFNRKSPRKAVSFKARGGNGRAGPASPKKRKEVQWRDEVGDGAAALEDYTSTPDTSIGTPSAFSPMPTRPSFTLSAPTNPWAPTSTSISAAEKMAQSVKLQRSAATGSLRNRASSSRLGLPSLAENGKPFSFLRDDPTVPVASSSRAMFADLVNSSASSSGSPPGSFSMAGPSGLFAPLVSSLKPVEPETPRRAAAKARRLSQIGPQRSAKPNRRTSFNAPPTPSVTHIGPTFRKASRGTSSMFAPPASVRKAAPTPRKAIPSSLRRSSNPVSSAVPRVSSTGGGGGGNSSFSSGKGSPAPTTQPAKGLWR